MDDTVPSPREVASARGEVAEFVYQAYVSGLERSILRTMDVTDSAFRESLRIAGLLSHDQLKEITDGCH